jgi:hypothetical protein
VFLLEGDLTVLVMFGTIGISIVIDSIKHNPKKRV